MSQFNVRRVAFPAVLLAMVTVIVILRWGTAPAGFHNHDDQAMRDPAPINVAPVVPLGLAGERTEATEGGFRLLVRSRDGNPIDGALVLANDEVYRVEGGRLTLSETPTTLRVAHPEYEPALRAITPQESADGRATVILTPGAMLTCTILDEGRRPIPELRVQLATGGLSAPRGVVPQEGHDDGLATFASASDGRVVYRKLATTSPDGRCTFRNLAAGNHVLDVLSPGYVLAGDSDRGIVAGHQPIMLWHGRNDMTIGVQTIMAQVLRIENDTSLPDETFRRMLHFSTHFPDGLTDLAGTMQGALETARASIRDALDQPNHFLHVGLARAVRPSGVPDSSLRVRFRPGGEWTRRVAWVPVGHLLSPDWVDEVQEIVIEDEIGAEPLAVGTLEVVAPYEVNARLLTETGGRALGVYGFPSSATGVKKSVPAGEYVLSPGRGRSGTLLKSAGRQRRVVVEEGLWTRLDMLQSVPPFATLEIEVHDASGAPASTAAIKVFNDHAYISMRPSDGVVRIDCEPATYRLRVDVAGSTVWEREVTLMGASKQSFSVDIPGR